MAKRANKKEIAQMLVLSKMGESYKSIGRKLGRSENTVKKYTTMEACMDDAEIKELVCLLIEKEKDDLTLLGGKARARLHELLDEGKTKVIETTAIMDRAFQQRRLLENASTQNISIRDTVRYIQDSMNRAKSRLAEMNKELAEDDLEPDPA